MAKSKSKSIHKKDSTTDLDIMSTDFTQGEKVLISYGPKVYEAKVENVEIRKKEHIYYVHYLGWNRNWDEWVRADRLVKIVPDIIEKKKAKSTNAPKRQSVRLSKTMIPMSRLKKGIKGKVNSPTVAGEVSLRRSRRSVPPGVDLSNSGARVFLNKLLKDPLEKAVLPSVVAHLKKDPSYDMTLRRYLDCYLKEVRSISNADSSAESDE